MRWRAMASAVVSTVAGVGCVVAGSSPAAAQDTADVYVVHGVPDTPVDVYVDGKRAIDDFQPSTVEGPVPLPPGQHDVALFPADAPDGSGDPLLQASAEVPGGGSVTIAAHLDAAGKPKITPFANDVSRVPAGKARVVVRHLAAAPAVDVRAGGTPVIEGLTNPNEKALEVAAGTVSADVTLARTDTVAIGPADLDLAEGSATFVHAIGSAEDKNLALVPFTVTGLHSTPSGVPAGSAPAPMLWILFLVAGVGTVAGGLTGAESSARPRRRVTTRLPRRAVVVAGGAALALTGLVGLAAWWVAGDAAQPPSFGGERARALVTTTPASGTVPSTTTSAPPPTRAAAARVAIRELRLPAHGLRAPVVPVGVTPDGSMEIQEDVATAGWYRFGPAPGDRQGSVVLSGHINDRDQGVGAFAVLADVAAGEPVTVTLADGRVLDYRVVARERFDKGVVPMARIFDRTGPPRLTLVTCGGAFDRSSGNYRDNIVVTAVPV